MLAASTSGVWPPSLQITGSCWGIRSWVGNNAASIRNALGWWQAQSSLPCAALQMQLASRYGSMPGVVQTIWCIVVVPLMIGIDPRVDSCCVLSCTRRQSMKNNFTVVFAYFSSLKRASASLLSLSWRTSRSAVLLKSYVCLLHHMALPCHAWPRKSARKLFCIQIWRVGKKRIRNFLSVYTVTHHRIHAGCWLPDAPLWSVSALDPDEPILLGDHVVAMVESNRMEWSCPLCRTLWCVVRPACDFLRNAQTESPDCTYMRSSHWSLYAAGIHHLRDSV